MTETQQPVGRGKLKRERSGRESPISTLAREIVKMPVGWCCPRGQRTARTGWFMGVLAGWIPEWRSLTWVDSSQRTSKLEYSA